ncbi:MAG: hypothetical protein ACTTKL_02480 [Treponema sp.]
MKKLPYLLCIVLAFFVQASCKTGKVAVMDNTFRATVVNNSRFEISIDGKTLRSGESAENSFPLHDSELYDGWTVTYKIPLSKSVFYWHNAKVQITDRQNAVSIENPVSKGIRESYIVVRNKSKQSMQITNGAGTIFASCLDGRINTREAKLEHNIAPAKTAVYEILKSKEELRTVKVSVSADRKNYPLLGNTFLQSGYVYVYVFDGKRVVKEDERPILAVNEPLWKVEDSSFIIEKIAAGTGKDGGNVFYAAGRQKVTDANGNPYFCPALRCMDNAGAVRWMTGASGVSPEGSAYDVAVLDGGLVLTAGQRIQDGRHAGFAELYAPDGTLADGKTYSECAGFSAMTRLDGDSCAAVGFDGEGALLLAKISAGKNALRYRRLPLNLPSDGAGAISSVIPVYAAAAKTIFLFCNPYTDDGLPLPSVLYAVREDGQAETIPLNGKIRSVAAALQDDSGALYAGGESADSEKSEAVIIKVGAESSAEVFYRGGAPFSYIAAVHFNAQSRELIASGVCRAQESSGFGGVPFIAGFDVHSGVQLWRREFTGSQYRLLKSFAPCADYGFAGAFASIVRNGPETDFGSSSAARLGAAGQADGV